jgi:hypothetical protein
VDELHDRRVQHRALALIAAEPRRHQQNGRTDALAAARLDVFSDARNEVHLRLQVTPELAFDFLEIGANGLEKTQQIRRRCLLDCSMQSSSI